MQVAERRWRAMGGEAHAIVVGPGADVLAERAVQRVEQLESRWSRFRADSDIARLARADGAPVAVSADTLLAVSRSIDGWVATAGRFDPTVGASVAALGYDVSFDSITGRARADRIAPAPGCADIALDEVAGTITVPRGCSLDLGGLGKGLAADVVAAELSVAGAAGVCINLGGDLRVMGASPQGDAWVVAVEDPRDRAVEIALVALSDGALATSNSAARTWVTGGVRHHHVIDPATGGSVVPSGAVTVIAGECWWAEVVATAATVVPAHDIASVVSGLGAQFVRVAPDGAIARSAGFADYEVAGTAVTAEEESR